MSKSGLNPSGCRCGGRWKIANGDDPTHDLSCRFVKREKGFYAVFLDFTKIPSTRVLRGVCCHELGHAATGALHKVDSPFELVERSEYRAARWVAENYLTAELFREAFAAGYTELWQLVEFFDLPEDCIKTALTYWKERKGIDFANCF
jgi:hypothetical protein